MTWHEDQERVYRNQQKKAWAITAWQRIRRLANRARAKSKRGDERVSLQLEINKLTNWQRHQFARAFPKLKGHARQKARMRVEVVREYQELEHWKRSAR